MKKLCQIFGMVILLGFCGNAFACSCHPKPPKAQEQVSSFETPTDFECPCKKKKT